MESQQPNFEGWALVEMFGHQREVGYVTTQIFSQACLFRVDVPEIPEREYTIERPEWIGGTLAKEGSKVKRPAVPGRSRLVGPGAIYSINPCTEEAARKSIEKMFSSPLQLIEAAPGSTTDAPRLPGETAPRDVPSGRCTVSDTPLTPEQIAQAEAKAEAENPLLRDAVAVDQTANVFTGGLPDETISSRVRRITDAHPGWSWNPGIWIAKGLNAALNVLQPNHGARAEAGDLARAEQAAETEKKALGE